MKLVFEKMSELFTENKENNKENIINITETVDEDSKEEDIRENILKVSNQQVAVKRGIDEGKFEAKKKVVLMNSE
jgi:hypothetical protein